MSRGGAASKLGLCFGVALAISLPLGSADAAHYRVLYSFSGTVDGGGPLAGLTFDQAGNLYGTTSWGGRPSTSKKRSAGGGVVFRISPDGIYTVLHAFPQYCRGTPPWLICPDLHLKRGDGANPKSALIQDQYGNLYGTTEFGGPANDGVVYRINTDGSEQVLHAFTGGKDGKSPYGDLLLDAQGNLYGTTPAGGGACAERDGSCGTVFKIAPDGTETVLHAFAGGSSDGQSPLAGLISDSTGILYGTTAAGGPEDYGTIFSIAPDGTEKILHDFSVQSLDQPDSKLVLDNNGNLFGTTPVYRTTEGGGVFELSSDGNWSAIYEFHGGNGSVPSGVIEDASGNLFGTTIDGDKYCQGDDEGCGIVFKIAPDGTETVLHEFGQETGDGISPRGTLVADKKGRLYGTTWIGGAYDAGTVYRITP